MLFMQKNHIPLNLMCGKVNNMLGMFLYLHIDIQNKHFVYLFNYVYYQL